MNATRPPRGLTMIEVLVCIAIGCIVAAFAFPVFMRARINSAEAGCMSNLRQIAMAMAAYRENESVRTDAQTLAQFGMPPDFIVLAKAQRLPRNLFRCRGWKPDGNVPRPLYAYPYGFNVPPLTGEHVQNDKWLNYAKQVGEAAMLTWDPNHGPESSRLGHDPFEVHHVVGVQFDGGIVRRVKLGQPFDPTWWEIDER